MVRTSGQVCVEAITNMFFISPWNYRIDQVIATTILEVCSRKSLRKKNALVIFLIGVETQL